MTQASEADWVVLSDKPFWRQLWNIIITFVFCAGMMGLGWFLGSSAMEWFGFVALIGMAFVLAGNKSTIYKTPQQAADYLFKKYNVKGE